MLYIDLQPHQTCHSKDTGSAYSIGVGKLGWQYETGLKSHGTVIDWCTGREWPVNCMTVISAWWQSWGDIEWVLNYYITQCTGNSTSLEIGEFGDWRVWRQDVVEKASTQQSGPPGLRLRSPGERERNTNGHKSGGQYVAALFGLQLPLTHNPFK